MTSPTKPLIIGTPLTPSAIRVMLPGSGKLGIFGVELFIKDDNVWFSEAILGLPVDEALRVPQSDVRLFGKPEFFIRRMGMALANGKDTNQAGSARSWRRGRCGRLNRRVA